MEVNRKSLEGVPLLEVTGDIDHLFADDFQQAVRDALDGSGKLFIDLHGCDYIDSGGIAVLLTVIRELGPGGWVGVIGAGDNVLRLLRIVGLTQLPTFRVFQDVQEALEALGDVDR